jgi:hypothetical protein
MLVKPGKPTKLKKYAYLLASITLGLLLSLIFQAFIEMAYLGRMAEDGQSVDFYNGCALTLWLQASIWLVGAIGGFLLGRFWWRWLYVDRVWKKNKK